VLVLIAAVALVYPQERGYVRGAFDALYDQAHGRSRIFLIGCTYWPRGAYEERRDHLLVEKYHVAFDVIGGIAPTTFAVQYQCAYNTVNVKILEWLYGADFFERVEKQARRDVASRASRRPL